MEWGYVLIAGILEVIGVTLMNIWKKTKTKYIIYILFCIFVLSLFFLHLSMYTLPMSITYAVWTGIGSFGSIIIGILYYGEKADGLRLFFMSLIVCSVIGLKLVS